MTTVSSIVARYRDAVETEMRDVIGVQDTLLYRIIRYHLGWEEPDGAPGPGSGGKALRPVLCLLASEGTGATAGTPLLPPPSSLLPPLPALPAAAAIELIHNFSLVHDDIQDQDLERHHRPTVWSIWGAPQGINAGDGLWALANRAFLRTVERGVPAAVAVRAYSRLNDACMTMIEGQSYDLAFEQRGFGGGDAPPVSVEQYLDMISRKTGALIAAALAIGALIGTGDDAVADQFHGFGAHLGRVFQIQDDLLGIWGQEHVTGKSTTSDIRRRKQSYPVVYTLSSGPPAARTALAEVYTLPEIDDAAVAHAVSAMEEAGARDHAAELATDAYAHATDLLERLPLDADTRDDLRNITDFLLHREY
jgi:geranylgeranyl diphosphate synthase, type I